MIQFQMNNNHRAYLYFLSKEKKTLSNSPIAQKKNMSTNKQIYANDSGMMQAKIMGEMSTVVSSISFSPPNLLFKYV